jgi:chemotaxis protein methyltransferase CheR
MIYFDKPTQARLLERFAPLLQPDGLLFVGHSENIAYLTQRYESLGHAVHRLRQRI